MNEKFDELLDKLTKLKIIQKNGEWPEDLPTDIWEEIEDNYIDIDSGLYVNTHRWYETSRFVIEIYGKLLGINYITNMFSESQSYEDCYHTIEFSEMEETVIKSYKIK